MSRGGNKRGRPSKQEMATSRNVLLRWLTGRGNAARWHSENKNVLCREIVAQMQTRGMAHRKEGYVRSKIDSMEKDYITAKKWLLETGLHDAYERGVAAPEVTAQVDRMCGSYQQLAEAFRGVTFSTGATIELDLESSDEDDESDANDGGSEKNEAEANDEEAARPTTAHKSASSDASSDESEEEDEEEKTVGLRAMTPVAQQAPSAADPELTNGDMRTDATDAGTEKPQAEDAAVVQAQETSYNEPEEEDDDEDESDEEEEQEPEKQPEKVEEEEDDDDDSESESDDSAPPSVPGKPSEENAASPATQREKSEPQASASTAQASTAPPPPVASAPTSSEAVASNTAQMEHKAQLEEASVVSPLSPQKRRPGRARRTVAAKATPAPTPKKRVGRLTRSAPKVTTPSLKREARDTPSPSVKRARTQTANTKSSSKASDIERDALLKRVEDERAQRLEMYEMDRAKLKCELEAKQVEVVCAKALARKKLLDAGIALAEVDRILPLGKRR